MKAIEIRNKFLKFFESKNHSIISGAKLIPENDPTVLFTTAGMQPLVPYLSGKEEHPQGTRLCDYQKCLRTNDIDEVGDNRHLTFFEMLGNWSVGDYFKEDSIKYSYEFLSKELGIDMNKISVTCFAGDEDAPRDEEAAKIWEECGIARDRIYFYGKEDNWWGMEEGGPCGTDTEIFLDTGKEACGPDCQPSCDCGKYVEIWNNVFMQYYRHKDGSLTPLAKKNVDTGMGLERITFLLQGKETVFETELFAPVIEKVRSLSLKPNEESLRIIADHLRAASLLIIDGARPSNLGQGYILRRLIRRAIRHMRKMECDVDKITEVVLFLVDNLKENYPELLENVDLVKSEIKKEKNKFMNTLLKGEKEFNKLVKKMEEENKTEIEGPVLFRLYDTFGFPPEVTAELAKEHNLTVDMEGYKKCFEEHQAKSRQGAAGTFKGGLADNSYETTKYHTATHLLNEALKRVLGDHVYQKGSNITTERARFDFANPEKVQRDVLDKVEALINEQIDRGLEVTCEEMSVEEAKAQGAKGVFDSKYGEVVKVFTIGDFSKEICGGPHVKNTSELEHIKIKKEEAVSSGVRRVKMVFVKDNK